MNEKNIKKSIENKWNKVYFFARMLINTDKYGSIGKNNKLTSQLANSLRVNFIENKILNPVELLKLQKSTIRNLIKDRYSSSKSKYKRIIKLCDDLDKEINSIEEIKVFILTCENIMLPINQAINNIPSNDIEYTQSVAKAYLDTQGEKGLSSIINLWDDLGVKGCLTAERREIIKAFTTLRLYLSYEEKISDTDKDIILSAFVQEFERRAGQKRKSRAGSSLEKVTSFILKYYNIKDTHPPEHFQADIEVDKWIKTKDKWLIGISCKRTLRERWKQVSSADRGILSKFKIKYIFHIITFDEDLSDDKLALLGSQSHIFYLRDDSRILKRASHHIGLKEYVRPITNFIKDLRREQGMVE